MLAPCRPSYKAGTSTRVCARKPRDPHTPNPQLPVGPDSWRLFCFSILLDMRVVDYTTSPDRPPLEISATQLSAAVAALAAQLSDATSLIAVWAGEGPALLIGMLAAHAARRPFLLCDPGLQESSFREPKGAIRRPFGL